MAFGTSTVTDFAGAASDLFAIGGHRAKAAGDRLEAQNYDMASDLATQNEKFTETSTAIKQAQLERSNTMTIGGQRADVASAGFAESGSSLDLLADSARQGALTKAVAGEQGLIAEVGYKEQSESFQNMSAAARLAAGAEDDAATASMITGGIKAVAGVASLFTGGTSDALGTFVKGLNLGGGMMGGGSPSGYG